MEVCYACHGVQHGPQGELATSECRKCHTESFDLVPADHQPIKEFAGKPHADAPSKTGVNDCMMCHTASKDCNPCHVEQNVKIDPLPDAYASVISETAQGPVDQDLSDRADQHGAVRLLPPGPRQHHPGPPDLRARSSTCSATTRARRATPSSGTAPAEPQSRTCSRATAATGCSTRGRESSRPRTARKCHPKGFDLVPKNHTKKFIQGEHKARAGADPAYCAMCHKTEFCIDCHQGKNEPNARQAGHSLPRTTRSSWTKLHGKLYLDKKGDCGACHDHHVVHAVPQDDHAASARAGFRTTSPNLASARQDCNMCHSDRDDVSELPPPQGEERRAHRAPTACRCHPEMTQQPPTSIQNKGFAEHAVHFNVGEEEGPPLPLLRVPRRLRHIGRGTARSSCSRGTTFACATSVTAPSTRSTGRSPRTRAPSFVCGAIRSSESRELMCSSPMGRARHSIRFARPR